MAKLAIVLCAMLFASTANSVILSGNLDTITRKADDVISTAISRVKERSAADQERAQQVAKQLLDESTKFGKRIQNEIKNVMQKAEDEINELARKAEGVDVTECTKKARHLDYTALAAISNMSVCITDKLETGSAYVESTIKLSDDVIANLTGIRDEVHRCGDNVRGLTATATAIVCANTAAIKATFASATTAPQMLIKTTRLIFSLGELQPSLAKCATTNGLVRFHQQSSTIVNKTKKCIQDKVDKAHSTTTPKILD